MRGADSMRREIKIQRHARFLMTVSNTLTSTALPALSSKPTTRPAAPLNPPGTAQKETVTPAQPSLPSGLVGHNVNTTA
jgi:hypothetical protein